ncbi:glycosyltransferase [Alkalihalophilus lindianensis]|uniref:Glycosyltransferase n=1 Tax=Alkalihalophilus lindianensis TaxID=1630542 RepID=A0ABU3X772_9BACI|nr:glycosyltransferase [Alkalihalophilus lindianensis]MDV2683294.1 glycosyltransferase [Alkalihalophilus lindianensis]
MAFASLFYSVLLLFSTGTLRKERGLNKGEPYEDILSSTDTKPISILVPAYNEEAGVVNSVRSLLSMNYPEYEVIVINDGSKDQTLELLIEAFQMQQVDLVSRKQLSTKKIKAIYRSRLFHNIYVVDKENGGKADALNAGINVSRYPYICSLDGDSVLENDALLKVMKPIIDSNETVIATGGSVRIANGSEVERGQVVQVNLPTNPLAIMQVIEYLRAFLMGRIGLSKYNLLLIISGAFGVFNKSWVIKAGGYKVGTVGEDMELVVRLHRQIKKEKVNRTIKYIPDPVCWTEAPESLAVLRSQRTRWQRGLFETIRLHWRMLFNPTYKQVGLISMPYFLLIELLGAVVEFAAYLYIFLGIILSFVSLEMSLFLFILTWVYGSYLSVWGVLLEEWSSRRYPKKKHLIILFLYASSEVFWYRPLTIIWRLEGIWQAIRKNTEWGVMTRKGISK